ncbi:type VII secretion target [Micromonosporaceae bacterium Da 78-11]
METRVEPAVLDAAAARTAELATRLRTATTAVRPDTETAVATLGTGLYLHRALATVLTGRTQEFGRFEKYLRDLGTALTSTADDYRRSDEVSADRFAFLREG